MTTALLMKSLPLVAAVLGNKYGVEVQVSGNRACTNGKTILIPSLPLEDDDNILANTVRAYIDHESAHVRETDFSILNATLLSPLEQFLTNAIEDWRVENKLSALFPGCKGNFTWLITHLFGSKEYGINICNDTLDNLIPNYILLSVRAWDVAALENMVMKIEDAIAKFEPQLLNKLQNILQDIRASCWSTGDSLEYAQKIVRVLRRTATPNNITDPNNQIGEVKNKESPSEIHSDQNASPSQQSTLLSKLITKPTDELPHTFGEILADSLELSSSHKSNVAKSIGVARIGAKSFTRFSPETFTEIKRAESAVKIRLQSSVQALQQQRCHFGRQGKIQSNRLSRIAVGDPNVFSRKAEKIAVNTAVHIVLDCSGSIRKKIELTTSSCLALARGLDSIKGINLGVTAFPAKGKEGTQGNAFISPIVRHGERVHALFNTDASGSTPMGEALWWVLQQMVLLRENRKIIFIITDGHPDNAMSVDSAIKVGKTLGVEFYGIGIGYSNIANVLPGKSCVVHHLPDLPSTMFHLLKDAITKNT